jgi:very-short-patch-repair endonuclease
MSEGLDAYEDTAAVEVPPGMVVEIEADPTLGYASIQNAVPVLRSLRLTNRTDKTFEQLVVLITCAPGFAQGVKLQFDQLAPGETRRISPIDLKPDHSYLADLQEAVKASIRVAVIHGTDELAQAEHPITVLAYDQWAGTRALPELLAAFCMPNNPAVDLLVGKASKLLRSSHPDLSMDGYQSKSRDVVWKQVSALYSAISAEGLQYAEPPASFGNDGQKIRTPDRILDGRVATCLDLAMLFASCFEQAGLHCAILFKEGHAWVGVWLHSACFPDPLTDDVLAVRKRVESGEFLVFETTGVAQHHSRRPSLRIATEQGHAHLREEGSFRFAVDIHRAREVQIKPLPSKATVVKHQESTEAEEPSGIEPTPVLPPLDPAFLAPIEVANADTPEGRLSAWKSKLLDLTLRNKLLNFKPTKATLPLVAPDLAALEDALADGAEFRIKPMPALMEGTDPRSAQVHAARGGRAPIDDMAIEALGGKEIIAKVAQDALDGNLLAVFSAARTSLEEGGANTLYIALGFLRWTEAEKAETSHLAPILLIPVTLTRQSVRSGFRLARHDDEAIVNPTLLQLLKNNFEMRVPGLDALPQDDKGIDVAKVLQAFRLAVREIPKWEVVEQAYLAIFSFTKFLMWKDLADRTDALKLNRVVKHLIDHPGEAFAHEAADERYTRLDSYYKPQDILAPMLSDSSQLGAICAIDDGRDLVLEGPPGTGKSQTITNLIAHTLAKGRTVLFVSEKMAALDVVHRRLESIGLGSFCLELHSSKAKKSEVLQQLGKSLDVAGSKTSEDWAREAERLAQLRSELNALVDSLHRDYPNGLTVFDAIGLCIANTAAAPSAMPWADPMTHSRQELDALRETARRMSTLAGALGPLSGHPLSLIGRNEWSPSWQDSLLDAATSVDATIRQLRDRSQLVGKAVGLSAEGLSLEAYAALDNLADSLLAAPKVPAAFARQAHDEGVRARVNTLAKHGQQRANHWQRLGEGWDAQLAKLNAVSLQGEWRQANGGWWPMSWFAKRSFAGKLAAVRADGKPPSVTTIDAMLGPLADINEEDQILNAMQAEAEGLLQGSYAGLKTDWTALEGHERWATDFDDAVVRLSGGDPDKLASLRTALQPLVSEKRALLAPSVPTGRALLDFRDTWRDLRQRMDALVALASPTAPFSGPPHADGALERVQGVLAGWQSAQRQIQPWCLWRNARDTAVAQGLQGLVSSVETGAVDLPNIEAHFEVSYRNWWLKKTIDNDPVLRSFSSADHQRKIREFQEADNRFQKLTERYIGATLAGRVPTAAAAVVSADSELGRLRRELQKQRGHAPVRQLIRGLPTLLPKLKPCLLMSPLSVAQYLDAGHTQFDLVVFDEASQIPVWDAVGAIARGKQLVVVGDPKQLPPTNFFNKSSDSDSDGPGPEQVADLESILDECLGAGMNRLSLKWHYRSRHESLITFSNINYYDSRLVTFPSPVTDDVAVRFERVHGVYDRGGSRTNRAEAEAIIKGIEQHYLSSERKHLTLGVVTFNQPQQDLIETLLDARRSANPALDRAIAASVKEPLFIKNLENVQGDERDLIFFSITYGTDAAGKMLMNFGPLNGEGGHRRLNVAISRAREGVVIYSSLMPEQIDLARVRAAGVRDLKHYLEFALKGPRALTEQSIPTGLSPDSPFETAVIRALRDRSWTVHPQVGCSGYRIDLAVVDPRAPGRYILGIECDGRSYHSGATARDRDRLRQHVLESLGWRIHRIWSTDWWLNPDAEMEKLVARLQSIVDAQGGDDQDPPVANSDQEVEEPVAEPSPAFEAQITAAPTSWAPVHQTAVQALPAYRPVVLPSGNPVAFYEMSSNRRIEEYLRLVIDGEGPLPEALLFQRVARAWNLGRTGARIVERLRGLVPSDIPRTEEDEHTFYWPTGIDPTTYRTFRVADETDDSKRHVADVAVEEIAALVRHVLESAGSTSRPDLARSVCRVIGMARTPADADARVSGVVDTMIATKELVETDGYLRPA